MSTRGESGPESGSPVPGEQYNAGPATAPRQAATVILLRGGAAHLEVLLVRRTPKARFMGGVWVFPGGAVDDEEGVGDTAHRTAALRELREEAAIALEDPDALVKFSRWITPAAVQIRFDTHFFLAPLPAGAEPVVDGYEVVDARWYEPAEALRAGAEGELLLVFPTIKHLEQLSVFPTADELLDYARNREIQPVEPRVVMSGEQARVLLPGEAGYDE